MKTVADVTFHSKARESKRITEREISSYQAPTNDSRLEERKKKKEKEKEEKFVANPFFLQATFSLREPDACDPSTCSQTCFSRLLRRRSYLS